MLFKKKKKYSTIFDKATQEVLVHACNLSMLHPVPAHKFSYSFFVHNCPPSSAHNDSAVCYNQIFN